MCDEIFDTTLMDDLKGLLIVEYGGGSIRAGGITFTGLATVITVKRKIRN